MPTRIDDDLDLVFEAAFTEGNLAAAILEPGWARRNWVRYGDGSAV